VLEYAARLAVSALVARLDADQSYRPWFWVGYRGRPSCAHAVWDYCDIAGRFVDAMILARAMTGVRVAPSVEMGLRAFLFAQQDPVDGLFYHPALSTAVDKYATELFPTTADRHVDLFAQRGPLLALASMYVEGTESSTAERLEALVNGLDRLVDRDGPYASFPGYRWVLQGRPMWQHAESPPFSQHGYRYALLTGLARICELGIIPRALDLCGGLVRHYVERTGEVSPSGTFRGHTHSGGILPTAVGVLRYARLVGNEQLIDWAHGVYRWVCQHSTDFGFVPDGLRTGGFFDGTCETCAVTDTIHLGILLSELGVGDYWDDVERFTRNQLLANQYRDQKRLRRALPDADESILAMLYGGFECAARPNTLLAWQGAEACCIGSGLRGLYLAWRAAIADTADETKINLGVNRCTPHVRVEAGEPHEGYITVHALRARRVLIRVPAWAHSVRTIVDGRPITPEWRNRYAVFDLVPGQTASVQYPLMTYVRSYRIADQDYEGEWRGGTLIALRPAAGPYPIYDDEYWANLVEGRKPNAARGTDSLGDASDKVYW
jgi:hypothetical protein